MSAALKQDASVVLEGLDWDPACQMYRCRGNPPPASHIMTVSPPGCPCVGAYLCCTPCVRHFWTVMADGFMQCIDHPARIFTWAEVTTFAPLADGPVTR